MTSGAWKTPTLQRDFTHRYRFLVTNTVLAPVKTSFVRVVAFARLQNDVKLGRVYHSLRAIREISKAVAKEIVKEKGGDVRDVQRAVWSP